MGRGLQDAKSPCRLHPGVTAAALRAAAGRDPGLDSELGPDGGHGARPPPRLQRWRAGPWRAPVARVVQRQSVERYEAFVSETRITVE
jgi:hypothetical protein